MTINIKDGTLKSSFALNPFTLKGRTHGEIENILFKNIHRITISLCVCVCVCVCVCMCACVCGLGCIICTTISISRLFMRVDDFCN